MKKKKVIENSIKIVVLTISVGLSVIGFVAYILNF